MRVLGIIPARYKSVRFPGKPLIDIAGKPMIQRVYERSAMAGQLNSLMVATDDERIYDCVKGFGGHVAMTSAICKNGTERCADLLHQLKQEYDLIINIQGDEPILIAEQIDQLVISLEETSDITTLAHPLLENEKGASNIVKVAIDDEEHALGFSRDFDFITNISEKIYKHIGLYGYRASVLEKIVQLQPTPNELLEKLEQLRWLDHGYKIKVGITNHQNFSVDIPSDIDKILTVLKDEEADESTTFSPNN